MYILMTYCDLFIFSHCLFYCVVSVWFTVHVLISTQIEITCACVFGRCEL